MDEQNPEIVDSLNQQDESEDENLEVVEDETAEESETSQPDEDIEELRKRAKLAEDYKTRAEIAERENKKLKKPVVHSNESTPDLNSRDLYALMQASVPQDDIDAVVEASKVLKLSVTDALKSNVVKALLNEKAEERKTASTTNTKGGARGTAKVSGADLLSKAERGDTVPDSAENMQALFQARRASKE